MMLKRFPSMVFFVATSNIYIFIFIYIYTYTNIYINIYIYCIIYICIYVYIYIYIYVICQQNKLVTCRVTTEAAYLIVNMLQVNSKEARTT